MGLFTSIESTDPDTGAHVTVERYNPACTRLDGDPHLGGTLDPDNPAYAPIPITENTHPFARFIAVLRRAE